MANTNNALGQPRALTAETIIQSAQKGETILTKDRRHAIMYLMATEPQVTNAELANLFAVAERTIRLDKTTIRKEKSKAVKDEDVSLIIADIQMDFERNVRDLEKSKKACQPGTHLYMKHCTEIVKMRLDIATALQNLGYYPKSIGHLTVAKYNYQSSVSKDGVVETRRVDSFDNDHPSDTPTIDAEVVADLKQLPAAEEDRTGFELGRNALIEEPDYLKDIEE